MDDYLHKEDFGEIHLFDEFSGYCTECDKEGDFAIVETNIFDGSALVEFTNVTTIRE